MLLHEFRCADCETDVFSFGGPPDQKICRCCEEIREMKARAPMTEEQEAALREIMHCVVPIRRERGDGAS